MSKITDKVSAIAKPIVEEEGCSLWDVEYVREAGSWYLRIYIDQEGGITLNDCEAYHRAVQPSLEEFDYDFLEVCSPGIDRPLKTRRDIEKSIGMLVEARLYKPVDGRKSAQGLLREMNETHVVLADGEETLEFPRSAVAQVRLVPDLSALDEADD